MLAHHSLAEQRRCLFDSGPLGGMDDVDGSLMCLDDLRDGFVYWCQGPAIGQGDGACYPADHGSLASGAPGEVLRKTCHIPQSRGHDDELSLGQLNQRNLPCPATLWLGEEMELVHHHLTDFGVPALAQRQVCQDLGGAADDGGIRIDGGVSGDHSDIFSSEGITQGEEFLVHQGLDRGGVPGAAALRERREVGAERDQ